MKDKIKPMKTNVNYDNLKRVGANLMSITISNYYRSLSQVGTYKDCHSCSNENGQHLQ